LRGWRSDVEGWILRVSSQFRIRGSFIFTAMSSLGRKRMKTLVYLDVTPYCGLDLSKRPSYCNFGVNELKMREWSETLLPIYKTSWCHFPEVRTVKSEIFHIIICSCFRSFVDYCSCSTALMFSAVYVALSRTEIWAWRVVNSNYWHQTALACF
jgi:hypothetical protein